MSVHPISAEGVPGLRGLLQCDQPLIREGIRAMLADRYEQAIDDAEQRKQHGWTASQWASQRMLASLETARLSFWPDYEDRETRREALARFHNYVYQWY